MTDEPCSKRTKRHDRWGDSSSEDEDEAPRNSPVTGISNCCDSNQRSLPDQTKNSNSLHPSENSIVTGARDGQTRNISTEEIIDKAKGKFRKHNPGIHGCREVSSSYERISRISEGTYGIVWRARDVATNEIVALKQIKFHDDLVHDGFPHPALREIWALLALSHECIVNVREMVVGTRSDRVFMAMDYMEMDLSTALDRCDKTGNPLPQSELKMVMHNILSGMLHIHENWYMHRDMKTSNILIRRSSGRACICDFGLARKYSSPPKIYTQLVITLW
mmetsp:Transcript_19769/g.44889  ORF Transcript_19769/g.44889 Transcript_19769/m.44889 type:complete len:277 (+) Transcript_19769:92-922(+)